MPEILDKNGFDYKYIDGDIYVEQEPMNNQDLTEKVVYMLNEKRKD